MTVRKTKDWPLYIRFGSLYSINYKLLGTILLKNLNTNRLGGNNKLRSKLNIKS